MVNGKEKRASQDREVMKPVSGRIISTKQPCGGAWPGCRPGFSLIEVLIVVAFMAIIMMLAIPALQVLAPNYMVRSSAQGLAMLMQRARLAANNTQKPIRVVLDCRPNAQLRASSCLMMMYSPNFTNSGDLDPANPWKLVSDSRREVDRRIQVAPSNVPGDPARETPSPVYDNINGVYWAVFMPTGRVHMSHDPMRLRFSAEGSTVGQREVSLNPFSGRAMVRMTK